MDSTAHIPVAYMKLGRMPSNMLADLAHKKSLIICIHVAQVAEADVLDDSE